MQRKRLQKNIMRRVYYSYAIRLATHPLTLHAAAMFALLYVLTWFVSVPNVVNNILHIEVGRVPGYLLEATLQTEVWTLVILGGFIFAALSLRIRLRSPQIHRDVHRVA